MRQDKVLHFLGGFVIAGVVGLVFNPLFGFISACVVGIGKEVYDKVSVRGTPEVLDAVATILGGVIVLWLI